MTHCLWNSDKAFSLSSVVAVSGKAERMACLAASNRELLYECEIDLGVRFNRIVEHSRRTRNCDGTRPTAASVT